MQFIPLNNLIHALRYNTNNKIGVDSTKVTTLDNTTAVLASMTGSYARWAIPFFAVAYSNETYLSNTTNGHTRFIASSDTPSASAYAPTAIIGTTTSTLVLTETGWSVTMTVVGSDGDVIKCLYIVPCMQMSSGQNKNVMIGALVLDNPVTLNAGNNYSASFAFEITF